MNDEQWVLYRRTQHKHRPTHIHSTSEDQQEGEAHGESRSLYDEYYKRNEQEQDNSELG